jgi:MSHA biogenesis protein MshL
VKPLWLPRPIQAVRPALAALLLTACATTPPPASDQHLQPSPATRPPQGTLPEFARLPPLPPPPQVSVKSELYNVVVHHIDVQELLFALARDAKMNVDIHPDISGTVTMNVLDQTLPEILDRIAAQVDMRYEIHGKSLSVTPDTPFLRHYRVDYPNIRRDAESAVSTSTSIGASGAAPGSSVGAATASNSSTTTVRNTANNRFWDTLVTNLRDLLRETDKILPEGSSETTTERSEQQSAVGQPEGAAGTSTATASRGRNVGQTTIPPAQLNRNGSETVRRTTFREAASVIANAESGLVSVRATARQHERIREFLDRIMGSARRQVMIEATIVEVDLSDRFQQGIDWSLVRKLGSTAGTGLTVKPAGPVTGGMLTGGLVSSLAQLTLKKTSAETDVTAALKLLESFGTLRVLSSPKISVLNSQTSLLKVVDNEVYFTITVTAGTAATATTPATQPTYSSTLNTVPIGFLMTVTPQISDNGEVILNLRPTISRISGYAMDPNPILAENNLTNPIPIVQTREMESVMRVQTGDIAILGGLMQDSRNNRTDETPLLNRIPYLGELFKFKDNTSRKSELVVFLRPTVLTDASLDGDFRDYRKLLPAARARFDAPAEQPRVPAP